MVQEVENCRRMAPRGWVIRQHTVVAYAALGSRKGDEQRGSSDAPVIKDFARR
jgi:hypothetical protein